jgi:cation diffusion facilitator CzcD-associated flavoprotein CzcO
MTKRSAAARHLESQPDILIIGAGISGLYQTYKLRELGYNVQVLEAGTGVGGTWYWNRYPGARFDSESWSYGYSFSKELLGEWEWSEHFSAQPETLAYVNYVADKFDLKKHVTFETRVSAARYDEASNTWTVTAEDGRQWTTRYLITGIGVLTTPVMPTIEGIADFQGESFHTARWPHEPVDFRGKRIAVIGTGATGVQTIQEVAKTVGHLTVFQRTPNYCAPLKNRPITDSEQREIKTSYDEIFERCRASHGGFIHDADPRYALELSDEEREAVYEKLYNEPGFGIWMGNLRDTFVNEEANATISEFIKKKIRSRVDDPAIAEKLCPTDHGFGTRRVPLESNYYEVYNQDNVELVDVKELPIERVTANGVKTSDAEYEFDIIVYATGFDAVRGAFDHIDFEGVNGQTLKAKWEDGPRTYLGMTIEGFPNLFTVVGPHNAATFCNIPRCIEQNVEWLADLFEYIQENDIERVEATLAAEDEWTDHVHDTAKKMLFSKVDSWFMGYNPNLPGRQKKTFMLYAGGAPAYRKRCDDVSDNGYRGLSLTP